MSTAFSGLTCVFGCIVAKIITAESVAVHGNVDKFVFTKHLNKTTCQSSFAWVLLHLLICNVVLAYPGGLRLIDCEVLRLP